MLLPMVTGRKMTRGSLDFEFALFGVVLLVVMCIGKSETWEIGGRISSNVSEVSWEEAAVSYPPGALMVGLSLVKGAAEIGAVCLDGTLPGYHLSRGWGSGANNWLIQLEGGGWCNDLRTCVYRKTTRRGSSRYMEREIVFSGILSNKRSENPGAGFSHGFRLVRVDLPHVPRWSQMLTARLARRSTHFMKIINVEDSRVLLGVFKHQHLFSCKRNLRTPARVIM